MEAARVSLQKNATAAREVGAVFKFVLSGEGGGTWLVDLQGPPSIEERDAAADCTLRLSAADYVEMVEGRVEGQNLFFEGKLQIEGDMNLAMKLQALNQLMGS